MQSFPTPPYQVGITEAYLNSTKDLPPFFYYSKSGRGTPDVAALGIGFAVVVDGQVNSVGGCVPRNLFSQLWPCQGV